ncbi:MAG: response regulator [Chromatiales bacterium]|jgi:two-component system sensor histidine kinase RpfC
MSSSIISDQQRNNPEFQSAVVRLLIWLFVFVYIGLGAATEYYQVRMEQYYTLFASFLVVFVALFISVLVRPVWVARQYFALLVDVSATSFSIFLTHNAISPIFLVYIWIFVSYGTRYGKAHLRAASLTSIAAYTIVVQVLDGWREYSFEAFFYLFLLAILPLYQYSLLKKLHLARMEAEAANSARGRFLATMTHELRTPLSGVIGMARAMDRSNFNKLQNEQLDAVLYSADKLQLLIADILDFSKIDAEKLELDKIPFDVCKTCVEVCRSLAAAATEKGVELICDIKPDVPAIVKGDPLRFSQILMNLVGNAVKFTHQGEVVVSVELASPTDKLRQQHLLLSIADTGIGIEADKLESIFDAFKQADDTTTTRYGGTGLGTAISRDLVVLMGGDISVESEPGKGSTFFVRLPLLTTDITPVQLPAQLSGRSVLLFEKNHTALRLLVEQCERLGMQTQSLQSVKQLSSLSVKQHFDLLVIADSPQEQELKTIYELVEGVLEVQTPVLFLTYTERKSVGDLACECLTKPFSTLELANAMLRVLQLEAENRPDAAQQQRGEHEQQAVAGKRILVAEDDAISAQLISTLLNQDGHQVMLVDNGYTALREATSGRYDMAFIDLRMPEMDGIEFTRQLRQKSGRVSQLPVVVLTANASEEVRSRCADAGANEFLVKPIDPIVLDKMVYLFT